jgi:Tol biopolymer transport system component
MANSRYRVLSLFIGLAILAGACSAPAAPPADGVLTGDAAAATAVPSATLTRSAPTLPPTFTPLPSHTPLVPTAPAETPLPGQLHLGVIYALVDGAAIVTLRGEGAYADKWQPAGAALISELALAPDGRYLAYAMPATPGTREVYVMDTTTRVHQQLSCAGRARVFDLAWSPDGARLAFWGADAGDVTDGEALAAPAIHLIEVDTLGDCGRGQRSDRMVYQAEGGEAHDLAWHRDGQRLFFSTGPLQLLDFRTGERFEVTVTSTGPDFAPRHSPTEDLLYYLHTNHDARLGETGGFLVRYGDTTLNRTRPIGAAGLSYMAQDLLWSPDGSFLLMVTRDGLYRVMPATNAILEFSLGEASPTLLTFSPAGDRIAFVAPDARGQHQVFSAARNGDAATQLTNLRDGTIEALVWGVR